jgi:hypothetical protein
MVSPLPLGEKGASPAVTFRRELAQPYRARAGALVKSCRLVLKIFATYLGGCLGE